jgi:hypothetical protein
MKEHSTGSFDVKLHPAPGPMPDPQLGQLSIEKTFHGDLAGTSVGSMLTAGTAVKGSAGYVAMEKVTGTLKGRHGSFILQHTATMSQGAASLSITVVPDSGTDQLTGLSGTLNIRVESGQHLYDFAYTLPAG